MKIIVTTGQRFTDIDGLACALAYTELLKKEQRQAVAVLPGILNSSVSPSVKSWGLDFKTDISEEDNKFVIVDISDPQHFAEFVNLNDVIEVYDHRPGAEDYWKDKLGKSSKIEMVGACATLIFEEFEKRLETLSISDVSANLLTTAIVSNTLNFRSTLTTGRDKEAFNKLQKFTKLPDNWIKIYFEEQEKTITENIQQAVINDTKTLKPIIAQLELWDSKKVVLGHLKEIEKAMLTFGSDEWFLTSPSISEGINYIFCKNPKIKKLLEKTIRAKFDGDIGKTNKLWLRKEIWKLIH